MTGPRRPPSGTRADASNPASERRAAIEEIFDDALDVSMERRATLRGALDSAETLYRRAGDIRLALFGADQTITALTWGGLAGVLTRQRRYAEADSMYRSALAVLRRHTTDTRVDVRRTYAGIASLYDAWGKRDSAAVYRRLAGQ